MELICLFMKHQSLKQRSDKILKSMIIHNERKI